MKTFITQKQNWKKIVLAALATAAFTPLTTLSAQAAPPDYAPAYGYRDTDRGSEKAKKNKAIRDRDYDGYDDRDSDRDGDLDEDDGYDYRETPAYQRRYNENNTSFRDVDRNGDDDRNETDSRNSRNVTLTGIVIRDLSGNRFDLRTSNGVTYQVRTRNNERLRLNSGDQVTVTGRVIGNDRLVIADRVSSTRNRGNINQNIGRVNFTATVTSVRSDREVTVRSDSGNTYTLRTNDRMSSNINRGDRVRITGRLRNRVVDASRIVVLDSDNGRSVSMAGTFVRNLPGNSFEIRSSSGVNYQVVTRSNTPIRLTRGDQVTVSGRVVGNNRIIVADRVRSLDRSNSNQTIGRINFTATVTSVRSDREVTVRSDSGGTYRVRTNDRVSSNINRGDRVRITGRLSNRVVEDGRVQLLNNNVRDDDDYSGTVNFDGRVQSVGSSFGDRTITVRADNGTTYRVRLNSNTRFDTGDRVRVSGRLRNNVVDATRIVLIDGDNDNDDDGSGNIDFRGRVESSRSLLGQRILTVRADNGTTYRVRSSSNERYDNGEYVRVRGDLRNGIVFANDINRL